jgi:glutathione-regulated potassium-efflux system protein KefB
MVSILLLEDRAIVQLLALAAFLAPARDPAQSGSQWLAVLIALAAVAALVAAGRWVLNPFFRVLASAKAREVMTAAALLVVLGAALLMQVGGLSMAMGAFLAGVLLSESSFRHQLEADVEPFRGILLGLFFMSVGMSLDLSVVAAQWAQLLALVVVFMLTKAAAVYGLARALKARHAEAATRAALLIQGGEFAFVLYSAAGASGLFEPRVHALLNAAVIVSMALTPLVVLSLRWLVRREAPSMEGVETPHGLAGSALLIGFGRFGQIVSQSLLSRGCAISIIDTSTEAIREARHYGFKIYYGDGTRPDLLRAAGAETTRLILVCVDSAETANHIVKIVQSEFPHSRLLVRARDREHAIQLVKAGVPFHVRETFESAMVMGHAALRALGVDEAEARASCDRLRSRDADRFAMELAGGMEAGKAFIHSNTRPASPSGAQLDT